MLDLKRSIVLKPDIVSRQHRKRPRILPLQPTTEDSRRYSPRHALPFLDIEEIVSVSDSVEWPQAVLNVCAVWDDGCGGHLLAGAGLGMNHAGI